MSQRNIRIILVSIAVSFACFFRADHNPFTRHIARAANEIHNHSLYRISGRKLLNGAVDGMVDVLRDAGDEHSSYVPAEAAAELMAELQQSFGGVGIVISLRGDPPKLTIIAKPEPGAPAAEHDVRIGDTIQAIDGEPTDAMLMSEVLKRMRGAIGEPVTLSLLHRDDKTPVDVRIKRGVINTTTVQGVAKDDDANWIFRLPSDPRLAQIRVTSFADRTVDELYETLSELTSQGVEGVVLDLRANAGGELSAAVGVSELFLEKGDAIVSIKDRFERARREFVAEGDGPFPSLPMVVLIDRNSASASEIVAACLQDNDRALIVGERSFGKGTVQHLIEIGPPVHLSGAAHAPVLKLTSASYWRPSAANIHRENTIYDPDDAGDWGVRPNSGLAVPRTDEEYLAYRRDRMERDAYNPDNESLPPIGDAPQAPYIDPALFLAKELLETEIGKP